MKKRFEIIDLYESNPYLGISKKRKIPCLGNITTEKAKKGGSRDMAECLFRT